MPLLLSCVYVMSVPGGPKGQGQQKQVVVNREHKNVRKASQGNHNRRMLSQRKRQQSMM
jgi:activating signal cointegrator complex subunit 2